MPATWNPSNPSYDAGYCDQDRKHLAALSLGYETPELDNAALRVALSNWRLSGILTAQSGARLNIVSGLDNAFNGIANQRPNKVSDDFYGGTLTNYLNRAAFAQPAAGTFGDLPRNAGRRPRLLELQPGAVPVDPGVQSAIRDALRGVQPVQPVQLGPARCERELGAVRPHHHPGRNAANHTVRYQVRFLIVEVRCCIA
jgi:hypothetical protein